MSTTVSPTPTTPADPSSTTTVPSPSCTTAIPDANGHVPIDACNAYYAFYPSFEWNLVFAVLFGLTTIAHFGQAIHFRKRFCWVVIMGALWECLAFILRARGARDQQNLGLVVGASLLLLLAPLWINAFAYMTVARLVYFLLPEQAVWGIKATWLTKVFVWLDIIAFVVQAAGGIMLSNQEPDSADIVRTGQNVYMGGIGLQGFFILLFGTVFWGFYLRLRQVMRDAGDYARSLKGAKTLVWILYVVLTMIMIRIIFRLVEFSGGVSSSNEILLNEAYIFGLDGLPMFLALALLNVVHPGTILKGTQSEFPRLTRKQKKELKRQKKEQKQQKKAEKKAGRKAGYVSESVLLEANGYEMDN